MVVYSTINEKHTCYTLKTPGLQAYDLEKDILLNVPRFNMFVDATPNIRHSNKPKEKNELQRAIHIKLLKKKQKKSRSN